MEYGIWNIEYRGKKNHILYSLAILFFAINILWAAPAIRMSMTEWDMGELEPDRVYEKVLKIKNAGDDNLAALGIGVRLERGVFAGEGSNGIDELRFLGLGLRLDGN